MQLTFEQLPGAISQILARIESIERYLTQPKALTAPQGEELLTISQASDLLSLAVPTIYGLVSSRKIPYHKQGKRLYFSDNDLRQWIKDGRKGADNYLSRTNKKEGV